MPAPAAPVDEFIVGKMVAVVAAGKPLFCADGNVQRKNQLVKVTNARSKGFQRMASGTRAATVSLKLYHSMLEPPPAIVEGQGITIIVDTMGYAKELNIIPSSSPTQKGRLLEIPARVASITDAWQADNDYTASIQAESDGEYIVSDLSDDETTVANDGTATVTDPT